MNRVNKSCAICNKTIAVPVSVDVMMDGNLAQARANGAATYCKKCNACYCFDHIVWTPIKISESSSTMTNVPLCPKCGEMMGGIPDEKGSKTMSDWIIAGLHQFMGTGR
jgi:hypothetical protein